MLALQTTVLSVIDIAIGDLLDILARLPVRRHHFGQYAFNTNVGGPTDGLLAVSDTGGLAVSDVSSHLHNVSRLALLAHFGAQGLDTVVHGHSNAVLERVQHMGALAGLTDSVGDIELAVWHRGLCLHAFVVFQIHVHAALSALVELGVNLTAGNAVRVDPALAYFGQRVLACHTRQTQVIDGVEGLTARVNSVQKTDFGGLVQISHAGAFGALVSVSGAFFAGTSVGQTSSCPEIQIVLGLAVDTGVLVGAEFVAVVVLVVHLALLAGVQERAIAAGDAFVLCQLVLFALEGGAVLNALVGGQEIALHAGLAGGLVGVDVTAQDCSGFAFVGGFVQELTVLALETVGAVADNKIRMTVAKYSFRETVALRGALGDII